MKFALVLQLYQYAFAVPAAAVVLTSPLARAAKYCFSLIAFHNDNDFAGEIVEDILP